MAKKTQTPDVDDKLTPEVHCAHDAMVDTTALIPNPRNPNQHPDVQLQLLAKIIAAQGWRSPITVSKRSGFVVRGHGRLLAAQILGLEKCPVDYQDYENEAAEWADLIADNRIAELSDRNFTQMADLLLEIDATGLDMDLTGYLEGELKDIMGWVPTEEFKEFDESVEDEVKFIECPNCQHRWPA